MVDYKSLKTENYENELLNCLAGIITTDSLKTFLKPM